MWNWNNFALRTLKTLCLNFCDCLPHSDSGIISRITTCLLKQLIYFQNWNPCWNLLRPRSISLLISEIISKVHILSTLTDVQSSAGKPLKKLYTLWKVNRKWIHESTKLFLNDGTVLCFRFFQASCFLTSKTLVSSAIMPSHWNIFAKNFLFK